MTNYYEPKTLREAIRASQPLKQFFRLRFFPENVLFATETVSIEFQRVQARLAPYTSPYMAGGVVDRDGYEVRTYRTPYLVPKRVITNDTAAMKQLGEQPYNSGMTPEERAREIAARDLVELLDMIQRREEYMCAKCFEDGQLSIIGSGVNEVVDYGFTGAETVTASDKWTASYDVIGKLSGVAQSMRMGGNNPNVLVLGTQAADALMSNNKVMKLMDLRLVDSGEIRPSELEPGVMYIGRLAVPGFVVNIYSYDAYYYDDETGTSQPMIDGATAMMISDQVRNSMLFGAVTYIDAKTGEYVTEMNPYVPYTNWSVSPPVKELYVASRPLPMPKDLNSWRVLKSVV